MHITAPSHTTVQTLVSVSTVGTAEGMGEEELRQAVLDQMGEWFGREEVVTWQHLKTYRIPFAQPNQVGSYLCLVDMDIVICAGLEVGTVSQCCQHLDSTA